MAEAATKLPIKKEEKSRERAALPDVWRPLESLRREVDRLFQDFDRGYWQFPFHHSLFDFQPFRRREITWETVPAVDFVEKDKEYVVTAELPGMDESNIEVKLVNGVLTIKGEKKEEKEEKKKDYYLSERHFGSFERSFRLPDGINTDKIDANFKKGVLTLTLPKTVDAQKPEKKISVKAG